MTIPADRPFAWSEIAPWVERAGLTDAELGQRVNSTFDVRGARKWVARRKEKGLTYWEADAVALAVGHHPSALFDGWWDLPAVDVDALFRSLRWAERKRVEQRRARVKDQARVQRVRVAGYSSVERVAERGGHRCDPEGCCGRVAIEEIAA